MRKILILGASVSALGLVGPVVAAPTPTGSQTETTSTSPDDCGEGNSLIAVHPTLLWPPNHKYFGDVAGENLYFLAEDDDGGSVTLATTGTHNQYDSEGAELNGSGNTGDEDGDGVADDVTPNEDGPLSAESTATAPAYAETADGSVQTNWMARAERAGTGVKAGVPNRTYTLTGMATFDDGSCDLSIEIVVPHDMGKGTGNGKKQPAR